MVTDLDSIDLTDFDLYRHGFPHELFSILRDEAPVWRHPDTPGTERLGGSFWVLSRHADVQAVSRDHARFRSLEGPSLPDLDKARQGVMLVSMDPPAHTRLRRLVSAGFTRAWSPGSTPRLAPGPWRSSSVHSNRKSASSCRRSHTSCRCT